STDADAQGTGAAIEEGSGPSRIAAGPGSSAGQERQVDRRGGPGYRRRKSGDRQPEGRHGTWPGTDRSDQGEIRRRQEALSRAVAALTRELLLQYLVDLCRVGLAFGRLHSLAHEEVESFFLPG